MKVKNGIIKGELKVKNGKLVKCKIELENGKIKKIKITGDFFMYPEEAIEKLEKNLAGKKFEKDEIEKVLNKFFKNIELVGASKKDFIKVITMNKNKS